MPGRPRSRPLATAQRLEAFLRAEAEARPTQAVLVVRRDGTLAGQVIPPLAQSAVIVVPDARPVRPDPNARYVPQEGDPRPDPAEADAIIQKMLLARHKPLTIARELNRMRVPTPSGGKTWSARRVKKIADATA